MGFWKNLFTFGQKRQAQQAIAMVNTGRRISPTRNYEKFAKEGYSNNVIAYRSIELISNSISDVPLQLFNSRTKEEIENHPILDLLESPNPMQGKDSFTKSVLGFFLIAGNSFIEGCGPKQDMPLSSTNQPKELWTLQPNRMQIVPGLSGMPSAYVFKVGDKKVTFPVDILGRSSILHMKTFNPTDNFWGLSPIEAAAFDIDQHNEMGVWNLSLLRNSARPSGALVVQASDSNPDASLNEQQRVSLRRDLEDIMTSSVNSGRPFLLEGNLDWKEMSLSPKDMDFMNAKNISAKDIALAFGVPSQLVGIEGSQTFSNFEQARLALYEDTVIPILKLYLSNLNNWLVPMFDENLFLSFDKDQIEALQPNRQRVWDRVKGSDWLTTNEKRRETGFGEFEKSEESADQILVQSSLVPLDFAAGDFSDDSAEDEFSEPSEDEPSEDEPSEDENGKSEKKVFNVRSESARRRLWFTQVRKRIQFERRFTAQIRGVFKKERNELVNAVEGVEPSLLEFVVNSVLDETSKDMRRVFEANFTSILKAFGDEVFQVNKSAIKETKDPFERFDSFMRLFIQEKTGEKITRLYGVTRRRVLKKLREEIERSQLVEGESLPELQKTISETYVGFSKSRSALIARTEVHNAATEASRAAAKSLNLPNTQKQWIAALDERTRNHHRSMNGVSVPMDEKFQVPSDDGIDLMDGPGDPGAPADQVINCRCTLVYSTSEGEEQ